LLDLELVREVCLDFTEEVLVKRALQGDSDSYSSLDAKISEITETRNALASQMADELNDAEFHGHHISDTRAGALIFPANALAEYVNSLAEGDE